MDREQLAAWWDEAWEKGLWCAAWSTSLDGLSAQEAAWKPSPERHCVWQLVEHMIFCRDYAVDSLTGAAKLTSEEVQRRNFPEPKEVSENAWRKTRERFAESQKKFRAALLNPAYSIDSLHNALPHDQYHMGQVMYVRAMMGKKPIE